MFSGTCCFVYGLFIWLGCQREARKVSNHVFVLGVSMLPLYDFSNGFWNCVVFFLKFFNYQFLQLTLLHIYTMHRLHCQMHDIHVFRIVPSKDPCICKLYIYDGFNFVWYIYTGNKMIIFNFVMVHLYW
jgi:hypothetical protein